MISLGGSFAALPMMTRASAAAPAMAPASQIQNTRPIAPMFTPALLTKAPDASHPTLCSSLCPNAKLHCQADGTCLCPSGQLCYNPPPSTLPPPLYTDPAGNTCPPSAVDGSGYCPQLSSGTQHPYTDPNGVTCYPDQLDGYGYCPGSLQPATDGGGYTTQPVPVSPQPIFVPQPPVSPQPMYTTPSAPSPDDGSQYASSQVPAPGMLVPVSTASPYAWSQLSTMAKIAVVLLGVGVVGGGYYMIKRRRRAAA